MRLRWRKVLVVHCACDLAQHQRQPRRLISVLDDARDIPEFPQPILTALQIHSDAQLMSIVDQFNGQCCFHAVSFFFFRLRERFALRGLGFSSSSGGGFSDSMN